MAERTRPPGGLAHFASAVGSQPCQEEEKGPQELSLQETPKGPFNTCIFTTIQKVTLVWAKKTFPFLLSSPSLPPFIHSFIQQIFIAHLLCTKHNVMH